MPGTPATTSEEQTASPCRPPRSCPSGSSGAPLACLEGSGRAVLRGAALPVLPQELPGSRAGRCWGLRNGEPRPSPQRRRGELGGQDQALTLLGAPGISVPPNQGCPPHSPAGSPPPCAQPRTSLPPRAPREGPGEPLPAPPPRGCPGTAAARPGRGSPGVPRSQTPLSRPPRFAAAQSQPGALRAEG